jgi:flagellar hook-associated protein 1 FlgK
MADLIGIGLSGLNAHQTALSVTGNNVANTNTAGYSRQQAIFVDNQSLLTGAGYVGQGTSIENITRISQGFLIEQIRSDTTVYHERNALLEQASSIDNLLASSTTGLTPAMSNFFQSFQGAADDPTSVPQRQLLLTQSEGLVSRFESLNNRLNAQSKTIESELKGAVASINSLSQSLAELNQSISIATGAGQGSQPNDLLDARDEILRQLSEYVSVSTFPQGNDGQVNVFIGNGQPLVIGNTSAVMDTVPSPSDSDRLDITLSVTGAPQIVSGELSGGKIGGLLEFRDNDLAKAINSMGRIAIALSATINEQHALGMDLEDNLGGLFFNDVNSEVLARSRVFANSNNIEPSDQIMRINITDPSALTAEDYELKFDGPSDSDFVIVRGSNNEVVLKSSLPGIYPVNVDVDGFQVQFEAGTFKVGNRFTVQPTKTGASDIGLAIKRVEDVALASPIRADASIGNTGNAQINLGTMLGVVNPVTGQEIPIFATPGQLSPPLAIRFVTDTVYEVLDASDPANLISLTPPINNQHYNQGLTNTLFTDDPGEQLVTAAGTDSLTVPAPIASAGPLVNGFGAQNLSVLTRDLETGVVTAQTVVISANEEASSIAESLRSVKGVQAGAYTQVRIENFVDDGDANPLALEINGEVLAIPAGSVFGPDALAEEINNNSALQALNIYAVSDGINLELFASTGKDIQVVVNGLGDSVDVSKIDPYSPGAPAFSTQTVSSGQGVAVAGSIDVKLSNGVSFTSTVSSVFEQAPVGQSTYLGFQFELDGEPKRGDSFTIGYNTGGVSDNRNALAIAGMETQGSIANGVVSYGDAYSQIIEEIGTVTNRARLDTESAQALLEQSENNRESVSGVNLDEEAGRLIQYQAAYNASAQVVSIARELFDTLLSTFR